MKTALIIGANGGIGKSILAEFYQDYKIFATAVDENGINSIKQHFPNATCFTFDHIKREEKELIKKLDSNIDCLIIASGMTSDALSIRLNDDLWDKTIEVNYIKIDKFNYCT
jgi:NADP-dependent 3-hydroxy acid dehydrogenase YdfG